MLTTHIKENIIKAFVSKSGLSDHVLIGVIRKINCTKYLPKKILTRNYKTYSATAFKSDLRNQKWYEVTLHADFNTARDQFKAIVKNVIDRHAPLIAIERAVRGKDCLWLTRDLKQMIHERDHQLRKAKQTNKSEDWSNYRRLRNRTTYAIRKAKTNYERSIFLENDLNPKNFWRQIKKCYPVKDTR